MSRSQPLPLVAALAFLAAAPLSAGVDSWTAIGPEGGWIDRLIASPAAPGTVWAISPLRSVFKTTDGATTWKPIQALQGRRVVDIIPDPSNASIVYAWSWDSEGYLKSTDGGRSWSAAFGELQASLFALTIAPSRPSTLYALSQGQLFKSTDGGSQWSAISELRLPRSLAVCPTDPDTLFVVTGDFESGFMLLRSRDGGADWVEVASLSSLFYTIAFDPHSPTVLYAGVLGGDLIRSDDEGETWVSVEPEPSPFSVHDWLIDPRSPGTLWLSGQANGDNETPGLWRSDDRGAHWTQVYSSDVPIQDIAVDPQAGILVGIPRMGPLRSRDRGLHWSPAHRGIKALMVDELAVAEDGTVWAGTAGNIYGSYTSLFQSRNGGATWKDLRHTGRFGGGWVRGIAPSPSDPETVHVASGGGIYTTDDGGDTWTFQNQGLRPGEVLFDIAVAPSRPSILYVAGGLPSGVAGPGWDGLLLKSVFRSNDSGSTWRKRLQLFEDWHRLLVHPERPGTIWVGGYRLLYRSTDAGVTWTRLGSGFEGNVTDLILDPSAPDNLLASVWLLSEGSGKVFRSRDGGVSWRPASLGLPPGAEIRDLAVDPARPATVYAATSAGVAVTDNFGKRWRLLGGAKASPAHSVAVDPTDPRTIYAGTDQSLFVLTRSDR